MPQQTVIFLGPQGSGKGTQVELLAKHLEESDSQGIVYFSAGKTFREFSHRDNYTASLVRPAISRGELIPFFLTAGLWANDLAENMKENTHLLIDGFPRMVEQIPTLNSAMEFYNRKEVVVVNIDISDEEAVKRLLLRHRTDDTAEGIQKRLAWSREQAGPIEAWFKSNPRYRIVHILGERPIEEVQKDVRRELGLV